MLESILFYVIFISQIVLISYYFPKKIQTRTRYVLDNYPEHTYPKLYPKPIAAYKKGLRNFMIINHLMAALGIILIVLYAILSGDYVSSGNHAAKQKYAEGLPIFFGICQYVPYLLMEISGLKQFKLMRQANLSGRRKAELTPRHLFHFISPALVATAFVLYLAFVLFELYLPAFALTEDNVVRIATTTICNLLLGGIIFWNIYGKRLDPHQSHQDRIRQIGFTVRSLVYISMALSLYLVALKAMEVLAIEYLEIILNSLYFQLLAAFSIATMLRILKVEDINFDVYKKGAGSH
ncbi:hypothetical protein SG34_017325 [Thalassomonas viridans]|uniref:Uncharacterized protein n=1 Tax=Thalassomonas viridans TaxID=137584 RepID=A0AAE9YZC7_9GAMM|nr:hypothetical protein [Thalassomonas viridans]WDE03169.1 hypothetical protein SG34_017325 [Thalassomonas viridans]